MDLWIRSQDKHLLAKYNMLAVAQVTPNTQAKVMAFVSDDLGYQELGTYNTKERALEVVDEIQKQLMGDLLLIKNLPLEETVAEVVDPLKAIWVKDFQNIEPSIDFIGRNCIVYEMPKD